MKLALAQLDVKPQDIEGNLSRACQSIRDAADAGADLVCLPEMFNVGYAAFDIYEQAAEPISGDTLAEISHVAADNDIAVLAGTVVEDLAATSTAETPAETGLSNTAVLLDSNGERQLVYRKHHLFGYHSEESNLLTPGDRVSVTDLCGFTIGITTCYDLRFPELYRQLVDQGATLVLVPSAWPYPRVEHWKLLPQARAVENLLYIGAVNGADTPDSQLVGRSAIYDPWGTTVATTSHSPDLVIDEIYPDRVQSVRDRFSALDDRRIR